MVKRRLMGVSWHSAVMTATLKVTNKVDSCPTEPDRRQESTYLVSRAFARRTGISDNVTNGQCPSKQGTAEL